MTLKTAHSVLVMSNQLLRRCYGESLLLCDRLVCCSGCCTGRADRTLWCVVMKLPRGVSIGADADDFILEEPDPSGKMADFHMVFKEKEMVEYLVKGIDDVDRGVWWGLDLLVQAIDIVRVEKHRRKNDRTIRMVTHARLNSEDMSRLESHGGRTRTQNKAIVNLDRQLAKLIEFRDKFK